MSNGQSETAVPELAQKAADEHNSEPDNFDDEEEETFVERLLGLTDMFPEYVQTFSEGAFVMSLKTVKLLLRVTRHASWIFFTSAMLLAVPVMLESERAKILEVQEAEKKHILFGPGAALIPPKPRL